MRMILWLVVVLLVASSSTEHHHHHDDDDHDAHHHHGEVSSTVEICAAKDGLYCFDPTHPAFDDSCFIGEDKTTKYCLCTETSDEAVPVDEEISYNSTSKSCESNARKECFWMKENFFAFYKGICYDEEKCEALSKDDFPVTWEGGHHASCVYLQARCAKLGNAKWDDTDKLCECSEEGAEFHGDHCHAAETVVSNSAKWGYGIIATTLITLIAVIGVLIVLLKHKWWYEHLLATMVALAMGCLLSDATLHLIPLSLGLHSHDDEGDGHAHGEEKEEMTAEQRRSITIAITCGVYLFLLFEKLIHFVIPHQHSHGGKVHEIAAADTEMKGANGRSLEKKEDLITRDGSICSVHSVAWMVIIGDALHNFADGLVMGAAFTNSLATGLGTSIAVFCHEVPHELGDFAVLLNAGMKIKFAVLFNFLSACTCFLGLFVGLAIGSNEEAQKWIFAFTAGMFIYIACADLIPEMNRNAESSDNPTLCFLLQQVGALIGFVIMYLIALFEEDLENIGGGHST